MSKRIFDMAMQGATSQRGPASGSHNDHVMYGGSRRWNQRYEYSKDSKCGFVELQPIIMDTIY